MTSNMRDYILTGVMVGAALLVAFNPPQKVAVSKKISSASFVPAAFNGWQSQTYDMSDYADKWQSINELLVREYTHPEKRMEVGFILEYSSDLRRSFSFHFPEGCHRATGNDVLFLPEAVFQLTPERSMHAKSLFIRGVPGSAVPINKIITYWLVIDKKQYYQTFWIKVNQAMAGLLGRHGEGFLVRVDFDAPQYTPESLKAANDAVGGFVKDLYNALDAPARVQIFGDVPLAK